MTRAVQLVAVLGAGIVRADQPVVRADDLGLTRGDGIFDATRVLTDADGRSVVEHLDRHLARLARSACTVELPEPDLGAISGLVAEALAAWTTPGEAALKIIHTRGLEHTTTPSATTLLTITESEPGARRPLAVATLARGYASDTFVEAPWLLGGAKLLSYAVHTSARREAARRGADDALFVSSDGYALEAPTSSLLWVVDGAVRTTSTGATGILGSVTVDVLKEWAEAVGVRFEPALIRPDELYGVTGAWLASSVRGVCPVSALDGRPVPQSDEWTNRLASAAGF
ncbi:MAG: aminodeoxychorismate lyase [Actinobacteria bacterium]|nr:aminodeoxychorismate lyase [Actinomycetota bacterium]